jgi:hypothetical protein
MGHMRRRQLYRYPFMTVGQGRRYRHKLRRELGTFLAGDGHYAGDAVSRTERNKGHATPRRADALRFRLAGRRFLEAQADRRKSEAELLEAS